MVTSTTSSDDKLVSEVEILKAQLAAAEERERTLSAELASHQRKAVSSPAPVKVEELSLEPGTQLSLHPRSTVVPSAQSHKSSASLGLMVSFTSISIYLLIS